MATNRSRRLRKKLCVDEFRELGFEINLTYREGIESKAVDDFLEAFISEAMEANELGYIGGEDYGFVCGAPWFGHRRAARQGRCPAERPQRAC